MLRGSPRWDPRAWGEPINQVDMAGTTLLFSLVLVDGLRMLGFRIEREECEDVLHLWRIGGWILGVDPELLCATEAEARLLWELLEATQEPPDADSAALAVALMEGPLHEARTPRSARGPSASSRWPTGSAGTWSEIGTRMRSVTRERRGASRRRRSGRSSLAPGGWWAGSPGLTASRWRRESATGAARSRWASADGRRGSSFRRA